jgi:hypothetical protein
MNETMTKNHLRGETGKEYQTALQKIEVRAQHERGVTVTEALGSGRAQGTRARRTTRTRQERAEPRHSLVRDSALSVSGACRAERTRARGVGSRAPSPPEELHRPPSSCFLPPAAPLLAWAPHDPPPLHHGSGSRNSLGPEFVTTVLPAIVRGLEVVVM